MKRHLPQAPIARAHTHIQTHDKDTRKNVQYNALSVFQLHLAYLVPKGVFPRYSSHCFMQKVLRKAINSTLPTATSCTDNNGPALSLTNWGTVLNPTLSLCPKFPLPGLVISARVERLWVMGYDFGSGMLWPLMCCCRLDS